jgi:LDH2 family malate/lactate/ureidoglycolate dehydrogenase
VLCKNANTYGPAFYYPLQAAKRNVIGLTFCNSPAAMPVWNGKDKLLGTNPFAVAIPSKSNGTIIFDMATSKVAKSKINEARLSNKKIPDGWALDEQGNPTTDPIEAIRGLVLPMGGFKGYGLALTIDVLSGVISGASFSNNVGKFYSKDNKGMNVGQTFIVIDPAVVSDNDFLAVMDDYINIIRNSNAIGDSIIVLPGDNKRRIRDNNLANGIKLENSTIEQLKECIDEYGLKISF